MGKTSAKKYYRSRTERHQGWNLNKNTRIEQGVGQSPTQEKMFPAEYGLRQNPCMELELVPNMHGVEAPSTEKHTTENERFWSRAHLDRF